MGWLRRTVEEAVRRIGLELADKILDRLIVRLDSIEDRLKVLDAKIHKP